MLQALFHAWERRLASVTTDRVVRPFDWGLEWIPQNGQRHLDPGDTLRDWVSHVMSDTDAFFTPGPTSDYHLDPAVDGSGLLTFPSALVTPHPDNNTVRCRFFPARTPRNGLKAVPYRSNRVVPSNRAGDGLQPVPSARQPVLKPRAAVLVMPQWNADPDGHVGLCRLLAWNGMSALRLSLPYHDQRMPPELHRADYIVSANVARTVQVCRQRVERSPGSPRKATTASESSARVSAPVWRC
jgi:hypothetical protein